MLQSSWPVTLRIECMHAHICPQWEPVGQLLTRRPALLTPILSERKGWWVAYGKLALFPVENACPPELSSPRESPCASQRWGSSISTLLTFVTRHSFYFVFFFFFTVLRCYCSLVAPLYDITVTRWWEGLLHVCLNTVSAVLCRTGTAHPFFFFFRSPNCRKSLSLSLDCVLAVMRIP